jgi:hypothetical protein
MTVLQRIKEMFIAKDTSFFNDDKVGNDLIIALYNCVESDKIQELPLQIQTKLSLIYYYFKDTYILVPDEKEKENNLKKLFVLRNHIM